MYAYLGRGVDLSLCKMSQVDELRYSYWMIVNMWGESGITFVVYNVNCTMIPLAAQVTSLSFRYWLSYIKPIMALVPLICGDHLSPLCSVLSASLLSAGSSAGAKV